MTVEVSRRTPADAGTHVSLGGRLSALAARIRAALDATSVAILIVDVDARKTRLIAEAGLGKAALGRQYPLDGGVSGRAISTGEPVVTDDKDARLVVEHAPREELSAAAVPIRSGEAVDGAICVVMGDPQREFDARDIALLECAAEAAGTSLDLEAADRRAAGAAEATVSVLSELADLRDGYVAADAREVVRLAAAIGARMGISDVALDDLSFAARVHDIGKIGVPDQVLHKRGPLTRMEQAVVATHPDLGAQILEPISTLRPLVPIVRHHHEHFDGCGYPDGLEGDAIPLGARVVAVADAIDAMVTDRPYRRGMLIGAALTELQKWAGSHYDPRVVAAAATLYGPGGAGLALRGVLPSVVGASPPAPDAPDLAAIMRPEPITAPGEAPALPARQGEQESAHDGAG
jgi:HD-GYP domain-containing protein (c-di-GMP phosphodiesterase class II)